MLSEAQCEESVFKKQELAFLLQSAVTVWDATASPTSAAVSPPHLPPS
jgi:hypothetical protein